MSTTKPKYIFTGTPLEPLTTSQWSTLRALHGGKAGWDILVALRGPDLDSITGPSVKWFTTSLIRAKLRHVMRVGGLVNLEANTVLLPVNVVYPDYPDVNTPFHWGSRHFFNHIMEACLYLTIPTIRLQGYWEWLYAANPCNITHPGTKFPTKGLTPEDVARLVEGGVIRERTDDSTL